MRRLPYIMAKQMNVKDRKVKSTIFILVFVWFAGSIFVVGCATDQRGFMMLPEKVLVIDLNKNADYQELLGGRPQTCGMHSGRVHLLPSETCGRHSTEHHEEVLVFLSGKGMALIGEEENGFDVGAGKVVYIPPHTIHNVKNTGTEPLVYIYCVTPVND